MPESTSFSVWIVEDDVRYRDAMKLLLYGSDGVSCDATFGDTDAALDALDETDATPDVLLLDVHLPGRTGIEALPSIRASALGTAVVILTISDDDDLIFQAFRAGASGYLRKDAAASDIVEAVRQAANGGTLMPPSVASHVLSYFRATHPQEYSLTAREMDVLRLMTKGHSQREIAETLYISPHTVNSHVQHLYAKLQVNSGIEAVAKAVRERLV